MLFRFAYKAPINETAMAAIAPIIEISKVVDITNQI